MSERLVVRLGIDGQQPIPWVTWSEEQETVISSGVLPDVSLLPTLTERAGGRPVEVLVDSTAVYMTQVTLPARAQRQAHKVLPFLLEEELSQDVDQIHFVIGPRDGDQVSVAAISHQQMQQWLDWLLEAKLEVKKVVPDFLALPIVEGTELSLMQLEQQLLIRTGEGSGMVLEPELLDLMLPDLDGQGRPWATFSPISLPQGREDEPQPLELPMQWLAQGFVTAPINLLAGPYAPSKELGKLVAIWAKVGVAAAVLLLMVMVHRGLTVHQLNQERNTLKAEGVSIYRQLFPNERRVINARSQLEAKVKALSGDNKGSFMTMLSELVPTFKQLPQLKPASLRFDASRSEIRLQLTGKDFEQFEQFKILASDSFDVDTGALNSDEKGVSGTVTLRAKG